MESQKLLGPTNSRNTENISSGEEDWSDGSSYSSYSGSDSTIPDWELNIDDLSGELLYIQCHPFVVQNNKDVKNQEVNELFRKDQLRRSTRGKFLRLIRNRESKRRKKQQKSVEPNETASKVKFQDFQEGEEKDVLLDIDAENRYNLSSDKSLAESLLGLNIDTLSDGNRVMIAGFSYDSKAKNERNIKIGDWLKSINGIEVNVDNIDDILQKFINKTNVLLKLQRVAGIDVTKDPPINELNNESDFVKELLSSKLDDEQSFFSTLSEYPVGVVYINTEKISENNQENKDVCYCLPRPSQKNVLCSSRGMYITLNHLLNEVTKSKPRVTTIKYKGQLAHVVYTNFNENLFLLMLPDNHVTNQEIVLINDEIIRVLEFTYDSLEKAFTSEHNFAQIDLFFARFFVTILSDGEWRTIRRFMEIEGNLSSLSSRSRKYHFEEIVPAVATLVLPDEAQMQIDDALAELEASDYRDWNEEPLDCQRLFTILGSALFHAGYLVATHLIHQDLVDVQSFCRQQGLFHLSRTEPIKCLVLWREVFPTSCRKVENATVHVPDGKRYLLLVGSAKDLLAVIMEAGGCTEAPEENSGPDAFYVEEAQATLAHIQELGLSECADRFLCMNPGTQVILPQPQMNKRKSEFINLNFSKTGSLSIRDLSNSSKKNEVTSILKRRSTDHQSNITQYSSNNSLQDDSYDGQSEESGSQGGYSEVSDESRRNFRRSKYDSNDEESEGDDYGDESQISGSSFDVSEIRQSLLSETEEYRPVQLTTGSENILYHFIQLDSTEGILLCPAEPKTSSQTYEAILNNFRHCCQKIHALFQSTLRFKNMPAQDISKSVINKSIVAIKEYGMVFNSPYYEEKDNKKIKITYCVVGRLFHIPHPRETYVCYHNSIPQNIIEMAFKMNMTTVS